MLPQNHSLFQNNLKNKKFSCVLNKNNYDYDLHSQKHEEEEKMAKSVLFKASEHLYLIEY
jgi:hypothetical protein